MKVGRDSSIAQTVCECSEMSKVSNTYGGGFSMPKVNTIDFSNVFGNFASLLAGNPAVFSVVFGLIAIYVLAAIWARRSDRKDIEKVCCAFSNKSILSNNHLYRCYAN